MKFIKINICLFVILIISNKIYSQRPSIGAFYEFPIIPIRVNVDETGISLSISNSIKTPIGTFGVTGKYIPKKSYNNEKKIVEKIIYRDRIKIIERIIYVNDEFVLIIKRNNKEYVFTLDKFETLSFEIKGI